MRVYTHDAASSPWSCRVVCGSKVAELERELQAMKTLREEQVSTARSASATVV